MAVPSIHGLLLLFTLCLTAGEKCEDPKHWPKHYKLRVNTVVDESEIESYTCPREFDPETFTRCCSDGGCCEKLLRAPSLQFDAMLMKATAIVVIILCLVLTAAVVICCFWSKCPFYNTCRANYNSADIIVYSLPREDDPLGLMPEDEPNNKGYTPLNVKIKRVEEV